MIKLKIQSIKGNKKSLLNEHFRMKAEMKRNRTFMCVYAAAKKWYEELFIKINIKLK